MLDLVSVAGQLRSMRAELAGLADDVRPRLEEGLRAWGSAASLGPRLRDRLARARTSWLVAEPLEALSAAEVSPARDYRVVACDGSQIFPDRHELPHAFVVNVGIVDIDYRNGSASLRSAPDLYYRPQDLYPLMGGVRQEADGRVVGARRFAAECESLSAALDPECVGLLDGTLLLWWLETDPERLAALGPDDVKAQTLSALRHLLARCRESGSLVAGYLSAPRATDVVSMLKVVLCTEDPVDCDRCPYAAGEKQWTPHRSGSLLPTPEKPCEEADGITDAALFAALLSPGQRSPRFRSAARVTQAYETPIDFFYVHAGAEVARVELPAWVDPPGLEFLAAAVLDQCHKGLGYPVALAEAHEQAVVRWSDRRAFLDLVRRGGMSHPSAKLIRKRTSVL